MNEAELSAGLSATPHYRYADRLGDRLFVAGQVPLDSDGHLVGPQDPSAQALQCLRNLERLLAVQDFLVTDIRQLVVYVVGDQASLAAAWSAVAGWFGGQVPPATLLGVAGLGYAGVIDVATLSVIRRWALREQMRETIHSQRRPSPHTSRHVQSTPASPARKHPHQPF